MDGGVNKEQQNENLGKACLCKIKEDENEAGNSQSNENGTQHSKTELSNAQVPDSTAVIVTNEKNISENNFEVQVKLNEAFNGTLKNIKIEEKESTNCDRLESQASFAVEAKKPPDQQYTNDTQVSFFEQERNASLEEENHIRILLFGETGVGKSTFINALSNYLWAEDFSEAISGQVICHIPVNFTMLNEEDEEVRVGLGSEEESNEVFEEGVSSTQNCKAYKFKIGNLTVEIIDTPGIGDTRGIPQDKKNMEHVLSFISRYPTLSAISILLKPNQARLTTSFEFCIKELLRNLDKTACSNIVFVFTNSRGTFYKPGDTGPALKKLLGQIKSIQPLVNIPYGAENRFCLDNEPFRFLVALKNNIKFENDVIEDFKTSWEKSTNESLRLISYISQLSPHKIQNTLSINEARRIIYVLSKPLVDISENITISKQVLQGYKTKIQENINDIEELNKLKYIKTIDLKIDYFDTPRTVCSSTKCRSVIKIGNIVKFHYDRVCHESCRVSSVAKEIVGDAELTLCSAMKNQTCTQCGCSYSKHLHIYYQTTEIETPVTDERVQSQLITKENIKANTVNMIKSIEQKLNNLNEQSELISKVTAKFAVFLRQNAIVPYNDAFERYIKMQIENHESLNCADLRNEEYIDNLNKLLKEYSEEKGLLDKALSKGSFTITPQNIFDEITKLKNSNLIKNNFLNEYVQKHNQITFNTSTNFLKSTTISVKEGLFKKLLKYFN